MPVSVKPGGGYQIDGRASIALDAREQEAVKRVLKDREHFTTHASEPGRRYRISKSQPVYAVRLPFAQATEEARLDWGSSGRRGRE